jgi:hypothetical protein
MVSKSIISSPLIHQAPPPSLVDMRFEREMSKNSGEPGAADRRALAESGFWWDRGGIGDSRGIDAP